jgi:hypothetical protein
MGAAISSIFKTVEQLISHTRQLFGDEESSDGQKHDNGVLSTPNQKLMSRQKQAG